MKEDVHVATFTDAPDCYDGFGSYTARVPGRTQRGELREVLTPADYADWQRSRYLSGPYLVCHDEGGLRQLAPAHGVEWYAAADGERIALTLALRRLLRESADGTFYPGAVAVRQAKTALALCAAKEAS